MAGRKVVWIPCPFCKKELAGTERYTEMFSEYRKKPMKEHIKVCKYNPERKLNLTMTEVKMLRQSLDSRLSASQTEAEHKEMGLQPEWEAMMKNVIAQLEVIENGVKNA